MTGEISNEAGTAGRKALGRRDFLRYGAIAGGAAAAGSVLVSSPAMAAARAALFRPAAVSGKIGFRFWGTGTERATIFKRIAYVQSLYPKLNVTKYVLSQNGYQDFPELLTEIASGTAPDALRTLTYQPTQLVAQGNALLDLSPYVNSDSSLDTSDFVPVLWKGCFVDGKVYAMPDNGEPYVVYYNQKAFKDAGIPTPATLIAQGKWNEQTLLSSAQALMAKGGMKYGVAFESWNYDCFAFMGGGTILDSSLKPVIDKSPTPETYQYFADLINKYKVAPSSEVPAGTYLTNFGNGSLGMYISGAWWGIDYIAPLVKGSFPWADAIMPSINGHLGCKLEIGQVAVSSDTKDPDAAWAFVSAYTSTKANRIWMAAATPARLSVLHSPAYRVLPFAATVQEMVKYARFTPFTKAGAAVDTACETALSPMWLGHQTAATATASAAAALQKALASA